jgi:hypothetical protein
MDHLDTEYDRYDKYDSCSFVSDFLQNYGLRGKPSSLPDYTNFFLKSVAPE